MMIDAAPAGDLPADPPRPGPAGRLLRLALGLLCVAALVELWQHALVFALRPMSHLDDLALMLVVAGWLFNYVINIGWSRAWGPAPLLVAVAGLGLCAVIASIAGGRFDHPLLGVPLLAWLGYVYGHLGVSFLLAAATATPGCELRALPLLLGRLRGAAPGRTAPCPASVIRRLDEWEQRRRS